MHWQLKRFGGLLLRTAQECQKDNTSGMAAALAFYTLLSLAPTLWVVMAVAGLILGKTSARDQLLSFVTQMAGSNMTMVVSGVLDKVEADTSVATALGLVSILFGATVVFSALQDTLNKIWDVVPISKGMVLDFLLHKLTSFLIVLAVGIVLMLSVMLGAAIAAASRFLPPSAQVAPIIAQVIDTLLSIGLMTLLFAVMYRILPDALIQWRDVWVGAAVTAVLFSLGKTGISLYLGHNTLSSSYGTAGSLVVFLLWVYYSAQIFLFGAEFTEVYAHRPRHAELKETPQEKLSEAR